MFIQLLLAGGLILYGIALIKNAQILKVLEPGLIRQNWLMLCGMTVLFLFLSIGQLVIEQRQLEVDRAILASATHFFVATYMAIVVTLSLSSINLLKKAQETIKNENKQLKKIDKMKDEFLAVSSHELKTPLTAIIGLTQLLDVELRGRLDENEQEDVKVLLQETQRLKSRIEDILEVARLGVGTKVFNFERSNLNDMVQGMLDELGQFAKQHEVGISFEPAEIHPVFVDTPSIKRLLRNLINNGIKYSADKKGKVTIKAKNKGDFIHVIVEDTGVGIEKAKLKHVFESFYQADSSISRKYGGTGLGLNICQKIVLAHGGKIWVESVYGKGSEFHFTLPTYKKKIEVKGRGHEEDDQDT